MKRNLTAHSDELISSSALRVLVVGCSWALFRFLDPQTLFWTLHHQCLSPVTCTDKCLHSHTGSPTSFFLRPWKGWALLHFLLPRGRHVWLHPLLLYLANMKVTTVSLRFLLEGGGMDLHALWWRAAIRRPGGNEVGMVTAGTTCSLVPFHFRCERSPPTGHWMVSNFTGRPRGIGHKGCSMRPIQGRWRNMWQETFKQGEWFTPLCNGWSNKNGMWSDRTSQLCNGIEALLWLSQQKRSLPSIFASNFQ